MSEYTCSDNAEMPIEIHADTAEEAAQVFVSDADWPTESKTYGAACAISSASPTPGRSVGSPESKG